MALFWTRNYLPVLYDERSFRDHYNRMFDDYWGDGSSRMEREQSEWQRQFDRIASEMFDLVPAIADSPKERPTTHAIELTDRSQCIIRDPQGKPTFQAKFNVKDFKPEEIAVSTKGNHVLVAAKHEHDDGKTRVYREYNRRIDLPPDVDVAGVSSTMSQDGVLAITAPLTQQPAAVTAAAAGDAKEGDKMVEAPAGGEPTPAPTAVVAKDVGGGPVTTRAVNRFAFQLPMPHCFKPDEIKVNTEGRKLVISGRHEETKGRKESMHAFTRQYLLPPGVDKEKMSVYVKDGRRVIVEAPIKDSREPAPQVQVLPVEHKSGS